MSFERVMGLLVVDDEKYAEYRANIAPLLEAAGARFRYDFQVARTLKSEAGHNINRVFVLQFPDRDGMERFFKDPRYVEINTRFFKKSVEGVTVIAESGS